MKKVVALAATALVVIAASQLITNVGATGDLSITRRVANLEKKVKSLQSQVKVLKTRAACLSAQGLSQYGTPTATPATGYLYTNDGGVTVGLTTALDVTASGQTPAAFFATVNAACVTGAASSYKATHIGHRQAQPVRIQLRTH
jgi:predicted alpha-1,6-mannanase (GH76 family)